MVYFSSLDDDDNDDNDNDDDDGGITEMVTTMGMLASSLIFIGFCLASQLGKLTKHNRSISELFSSYKTFPREPHPLILRKVKNVS